MMCEKCWSDAYLNTLGTTKTQAERYGELMDERKDNPCTPEQQAGEDAKECPKCKRRTVHQIVGDCIICN